MIRLEGEVDPARVVDLRWAVLRPHQERVASIYPDDGAPGARLMKAIQVYAIEWQTGVWCNARTAAGEFYEAMGLSGHGEVFDLPPLGPHRIYRWRP